MRKFILSTLFLILAVSFVNAQSGLGYLKGYVKCGGIGNDGCSVSGATVTLKPIENHSKSLDKITTQTDSSGYFKIEASFGEYELIISAVDYATYQTTVYLPSSANLNWAVRLQKPQPAGSIEEIQSKFGIDPDLDQGDAIYQPYKEKNQKPPLAEIAKAVSLYSAAVRRKPTKVEAYRKRAEARDDLFLGVNPYTIADLQTVLRLDPSDTGSKAKLAKYQSEYKKMYVTKECIAGRNLKAFGGHESEPRTQLTMDLDSSLDENYDPKPALKDIACGADVNYSYKKDERSPQFWSVLSFQPELIIAMLEAVAKTESTDKFGNTVLMMTLQDFIKDKEAGLVDDDYRKKNDISGKILILKLYGANLYAKNLKGETVASLGKKANEVGIDIVLNDNGKAYFDGTWTFEERRNGQQFGLSIRIDQKDGKLTGEYTNLSSKESNGKILSSKIVGNRATIEVDCDWGGRGTVEITLLKGDRLHWKVIKRDELKGKFIVLQDEILTK